MPDDGQVGSDATTAAGWYEDSGNRRDLRYWTGSEWSGHENRAPGASGSVLVGTTDLDAAPLGFGRAISSAFRNAVRFDGRASRSAFWWFALVAQLVAIAIAVVGALAASGADQPSQDEIPWPYLVFFLVFVLPWQSLIVRRLHDRNMSGKLALLQFVPAGLFILLIICLQEGTPGPNSYSISPR